MRLEHLTPDEEDFWRGEFAQENWIFGALGLSVTLPEFAGGVPALRTMHFGYFLELSGAGIRIPHCFPQGFTLGSVLRITLQEMKKLPLKDEGGRVGEEGGEPL